MDNDLEQFRAIERLPLDKVRCPTLVVHGTHDRAVPFSQGENSTREIPGAELHRVENPGRIGTARAPSVSMMPTLTLPEQVHYKCFENNVENTLSIAAGGVRSSLLKGVV